MPVPDFQSIMLPLLKFSADGAEHTPREAVESLAKVFNLTDDDRQELLPSGTQRMFDNRVAWSKTHLLKAGLLDSPRRSYFRITERGLSVITQGPTKVNIAFLRQYAEYVDFQGIKRSENGIEEISTNEEIVTQTPEETLENS